MSFLPNHIHTEKTLDGVIVKYTFMRYSVPVMVLKLPGDALKIKKTTEQHINCYSISYI